MRLFVLSLFVIGFFGIATIETSQAVRASSEDARVNLTRVMIEKARAIGRDKPLGTPTDGYEAVKSMVYQEIRIGDTDPERRLEERRLYLIADFVQGWTELERNPSMKDKALSYELSMGTKAEGTEDVVIVRFRYPNGTVPPHLELKGFEWRLRWRRIDAKPRDEIWRLETVTKTPLIVPAASGRAFLCIIANSL